MGDGAPHGRGQRLRGVDCGGAAAAGQGRIAGRGWRDGHLARSCRAGRTVEAVTMVMSFRRSHLIRICCSLLCLLMIYLSVPTAEANFIKTFSLDVLKPGFGWNLPA